MHYLNSDFRSTPLRTLCTSSSNAIDELMEFSKNSLLLDGLTALEYAEYFYGAVLVACQAYAVGTVSDVNVIRESQGKEKVQKFELYKYSVYPKIEPTDVEFINALANYFKHHDEWPQWPNNETVKILRRFDITEKTEFPLKVGSEKLIGYYPDLRGLCQVLETWRMQVFQKWCENA
ncbi:hypothetical protein [Cellvibrio fibrivorans]|uniref:Antitoxin SocA-like Panacea domain-containing protein n=1 Tax=Cellvibrio fibrivorans TaxID=126350 RepID=A0ABU1UTW3_9GAMM|nr:hypothetical protein [Cellvibrio fibrivorans]MDR7088595.1 hypothetical protein [Cellvibrio fibrivorans]